MDPETFFDGTSLQIRVGGSLGLAAVRAAPDVQPVSSRQELSIFPIQRGSRGAGFKTMRPKEDHIVGQRLLENARSSRDRQTAP